MLKPPHFTHKCRPHGCTGITAVRIMLYMAVARAAGGNALGFAPVAINCGLNLRQLPAQS
jgi:hypothetical protein